MKFLFLGLLLLIAAIGAAQTKGKSFDYKDGDTTLEGYIAMPKSDAVPMPAVLIVHDWNGLDDYEKRRADMIADLGYVGFAVDIYGKGVRPKTPEENRAQSGKYRSDPPLLRGRIQAALDALKAMPNVDKDHIAIMGYCFGGGATLEFARSGAPIVGAISFHGNLNTTTPATAGTLKARILVLHGADDPAVPQTQVQAFIDEMKSAKADWQLVQYGNAVHAFTVPEAGNDNSKGAAYNKEADERSWEALQQFLAEVLLVKPQSKNRS